MVGLIDIEPTYAQPTPLDLSQQQPKDFPASQGIWNIKGTVPLTGPTIVTSSTAEQAIDELFLGTIFDNMRFPVRKAIPVQIKRMQDYVVAQWEEVEEFGTGETISDACSDLAHSISALYESLEEENEHLGPDLARVFHVMKEHIVHIRNA